MPFIAAWLLSQLPDFAASVAVEILTRTGFFTAAQTEVTEAGVKILHVVGNVKTYSQPSDFPSGKNGA